MFPVSQVFAYYTISTRNGTEEAWFKPPKCKEDLTRKWLRGKEWQRTTALVWISGKCLPLGLFGSLDWESIIRRAEDTSYTLEKQVRNRMDALAVQGCLRREVEATRTPRQIDTTALPPRAPRPLTCARLRPSATLAAGSPRPPVTSNREPLNGSQGAPQGADWAPAGNTRPRRLLWTLTRTVTVLR